MRPVLLATDGACDVQVAPLAQRLNSVCKHLRFSTHEDAINIGAGPISHPETYEQLHPQTSPLLQSASSIIIATDRRYVTNFFWEATRRVILVSFSGWEFLTNLSKNNGLVGFIVNALSLDLDPVAERHNENTGCIFDMLWDKRGIDARLRSGVLCKDCFARIQAVADADSRRMLRRFDCSVADGLRDLQALLDDVSLASRREVDILDRWAVTDGGEPKYDVFLCYNSEDVKIVRDLYRKLSARGLRPWFDEEVLLPGTRWQEELQRAIPSIASVAVAVGPTGEGPWQSFELNAFLLEFAKHGIRIIPVLLPGTRDVPMLPVFLRQFVWVDYRDESAETLDRLIWGITGVKPS